MTTQTKIDILEKAVRLINYNLCHGVCGAVTFDLFYPEDEARRIEELDLKIPPPRYSYDNDPGRRICWSWPCNEEGDEQRRAFLQKRIDELKTEL